ncbi:MAG: TetR/AcrR family transcriptional regulator, partial [Candidatus Acidiferrum sp.]
MSMPSPRVDIAGIRRRQIIEAAETVIAERGLQNLSLAEIEKKAGMSRGQLTYYYPQKEDILLAVFDHLIDNMRRRTEAAHSANGACSMPAPGWERTRLLLKKIMLEQPPVPELGTLQYTFLAQIGHREDFRARLANLYEAWRAHMAEDFAAEANRHTGRTLSPRAFSTFVQAVIHGLGMQRAADPEAFDRLEMLELMLDVFGTYLNQPDKNHTGMARSGRRTTKVNHD